MIKEYHNILYLSIVNTNKAGGHDLWGMTALSAFHFLSYAFPVGAEFFHHCPKILAVIHMDKVAKLVQADVVDALSAKDDKL